MAMPEDIVESVCRNIKEEFGDIPVYTERVVQGLEEPCFFVYMEESIYTRFFGERFFMQNKVAVKYFAKYQTENSSCASVVERLCMILEQIECDGIIRGTKPQCDIKEGILNFEIYYNFFVKKKEKPEDTELMQSMKLKYGEDM